MNGALYSLLGNKEINIVAQDMDIEKKIIEKCQVRSEQSGVSTSSAHGLPKGSEFAYFAETKFCFGGSEIKILESGLKEAGGSDINISAVSRP